MGHFPSPNSPHCCGNRIRWSCNGWGTLENRGLVVRDRDPDDGRRTMLRLTESGIAIMPTIHHTRAVNERVSSQRMQELGIDLCESLGQLEAMPVERRHVTRMMDAAQAIEDESV